jgi:hypothetical protein
MPTPHATLDRHVKRQYCPCLPQLTSCQPTLLSLTCGAHTSGSSLPPPSSSSLPPSTKHDSAFQALASSAPLPHAARSAAAVRWGSGRQPALFTRSSLSGSCVAAYLPERCSSRCWRIALPRTAHKDPRKKLQAVAGRSASHAHGPERPIVAAWRQLEFFSRCSDALGNYALSTEAERRKMVGGRGLP